MERLVGRRVLITLTDNGQTYEGTLRSVCGEGSSTFTFSEVTIASGRSISGVINLMQSEIASLKPVGAGDREETAVATAAADIPIDRWARPLMCAREDHSRRLRSQNSSSRAGENSFSRAGRTAPADLKESPAPKLVQLDSLPPRGAKTSPSEDIPRHYFVVNKLDEVFDEVLWRLWSEPVIGLAFEGVRICRHGTLGWMQVSTRDCIYLFDILTLTDECMSQGLCDLLTSSHTLKVIHDCRYISDMMFHRYHIRLVNVFDTQVADLVIYKNLRDGEVPNYVTSLNVCLSKYLNITTDASGAESSLRRVRAYFEEEDEAAWLKRPATKQILLTAAESVLYLLPLYKRLQELLLSDFVTAMQAYMLDLRQCQDLPSPLPPRHVVSQTVKNVLQNKGRNSRWSGPKHLAYFREIADYPSVLPEGLRTATAAEGGETCGYLPVNPRLAERQPAPTNREPRFGAQKTAPRAVHPRTSDSQVSPGAAGSLVAAAGGSECQGSAVRPCLAGQPLETTAVSPQPVRVVARRGLSHCKSVPEPLPGVAVDGIQPHFLIPMSDSKP